MGLRELLDEMNPWRQATAAARAERDVAVRELEKVKQELVEMKAERDRLKKRVEALHR